MFFAVTSWGSRAPRKTRPLVPPNRSYRRLEFAFGAVVVGVIVSIAGCGSPAATAPTAATSPTATTAPTAPASPASTIPEDQPSTVVSKSPRSTVLTSPDSVGKVAAFYSDVLKKDGWQVRSSSVSSYHGSFSARRENVYARGSGSGITVTT